MEGEEKRVTSFFSTVKLSKNDLILLWGSEIIKISVFFIKLSNLIHQSGSKFVHVFSWNTFYVFQVDG